MRSKGLLAGLLAVAAGLVLVDQWPSAPSAPAMANAGPAERSPEAAPAPSRLSALPARGGFAEPQGELFAPRSWTAAPPAPRAAARVEKQKPATPPMPYRVAGQVMRESGMHVVLAKGNRIYEVREGETLEDGYRVESIRPDAVTLLYVALGTSERLPVAGTPLSVDSTR